MDRRVILAVAGAGKTYTICNKIDLNKRNLIIAYTNENVFNIKRELLNRFGKIPELTSVRTFHSFIYNYMLCPYEPTILKKFGKDGFKRKGITVKEPPSQRINGRYNYEYIKNNKLEHYENNGFYYCDTISELILNTDKGNSRNGIIKKIINRMNMFYDQVMIDEFQDFRKNDYKLIEKLIKGLNNVLLVGDYYQHSVLGRNNSGAPFQKGKNNISYQEFLKILKNSGLKVDNKTLSKSRRCPINICDFISNKLNIGIYSNNENYGEIKFIEDYKVEDILKNDSIIKLVNRDAKKYKFKSVNWSYSKGNTYDSVCVILTDKFENIDSEEFDISNIGVITVNKIYVAFSRTRGDLILIKKSQFDKVKEKYKK